MNSKSRFLFCLLSFLVFMPGAHAYIPSSRFLLQKMDESQKAADSVWIHSQIQTANGDSLGGESLDEQMYFHVKSKFMESVLLEGDRPVASRKRNIDTLPKEQALVSRLLLDSNLNTLVQVLQKWRLPIRTEAELAMMKNEEERRASEVTFLRRWEGLVAYVIGTPNSPTMPQLWIEKDAFRPLRLVLPTYDAEISQLELRFSKFQTVKDFAYPSEIDCFENGTRRLNIKLIKMVVNPEPRSLKMPSLPSAASRDSALVEKFYSYVR